MPFLLFCLTTVKGPELQRCQDNTPIVRRGLKQATITFEATPVQPARLGETIRPHIEKLRVIKTEALPENITPTLRTP
jgi:hypothetical protein